MRYLLLILILTQWPAHADLDQYQQQGLSQTKDLLTNPQERQKFIDKDPKAKDVDNKVDALAGSKQNKEDIYGLAAQLMEKITLESNGDVEKMQRLMDEAQKNPEAFYNKYFSDEQKAKVHSIAGKIESDKPGLGPQK